MLWNRKPLRLIDLLLTLTTLLIAAQILFFFIHYKVADIIDSLASTSIIHTLFSPVILLPLFIFLGLQLIAYGLFIGWIWLVTTSVGEICQFSEQRKYISGVFFWLLSAMVLFSYNTYYYPYSFFSRSFLLNPFLIGGEAFFFSAAILLTVTNCFWFKRHRWQGVAFLLLAFLANVKMSPPLHASSKASAPNIILIGLDSLRPDYIHFLGNKQIHTPHIDHFLQTAVVLSNAYTPLARTFPSWISILTAKYPLHHHARMNLANPAPILQNDNLAKKLKNHGYFTIYGTDEMRFTDITSAYGFDRIIGPKGGAVEFLLGSLSDFPLTNLLINLPIGKWIFPYNFGNRAADITYQPDRFLSLVQDGIAHRPDKPVLLAIHLCLSHWPFRWAQDGQTRRATILDRYKNSIEAIDAQLGELLDILQQAALLDNSVVVLLSDHGVTLGMDGDRSISKKHYCGGRRKLNLVSAYKLGSAPDFTLDIKQNYTISTSYGQGTDVLSLKQNHILLAFKRFGLPLVPHQINEFSSVLSIAPTILDYLHYPPIPDGDGRSLKEAIFAKAKTQSSLPFFIETGDKVAEMETNHIFIEKVLKHTVSAYRLDKENGLLVLIPEAEKSLIANKQHAILSGDWLLAHYPAEMRYQLKPIVPNKKNQPVPLMPVKIDPYFVLVNLKTGKWTVDLSSSFAKKAPIAKLMTQLKTFYGNEV